MSSSEKEIVCVFYTKQKFARLLILLFLFIILLFLYKHSRVYKENPSWDKKVAWFAEWIIVRVHDLFMISFLDGNSPNRVVSSCQNAIMHVKPYMIALRVRFSGVRCLLLIKFVLLIHSIGQEA